MKELQFIFRENVVRAFKKNGEPWFVMKDVCDVLGILKHRDALLRLDEDERGTVLVDTLGGKQHVGATNEWGLYTLILNSRKPEAREFKRWITHEVIPSIRKHGAYATESTLESMINDPDTAIRLLQALKQEQEQAKFLRQKAIENAPKVLFAEAVESSSTTISVNNLAKLISQNGVNIGEIKLYQWLRDNEYLIREKGMDYNTPRQKYINQGLFEIKETVYTGSKGNKIAKTTRVTGKGQNYFINKFLKADFN